MLRMLPRRLSPCMRTQPKYAARSARFQYRVAIPLNFGLRQEETTLAAIEKETSGVVQSGSPPGSAGTGTEWHRLTAEAVAKQLNVDPATGLSAAEAQQRLQKYGPNEL